MAFSIGIDEIQCGFVQIEDAKNEISWQLNQLQPLLTKAHDETSTEEYNPLEILTNMLSALEKLNDFEKWLKEYERDFKDNWIDSMLEKKHMERHG